MVAVEVAVVVAAAAERAERGEGSAELAAAVFEGAVVGSA